VVCSCQDLEVVRVLLEINFGSDSRGREGVDGGKLLCTVLSMEKVYLRLESWLVVVVVVLPLRVKIIDRGEVSDGTNLPSRKQPRTVIQTRRQDCVVCHCRVWQRSVIQYSNK